MESHFLKYVFVQASWACDSREVGWVWVQVFRFEFGFRFLGLSFEFGFRFGLNGCG